MHIAHRTSAAAVGAFLVIFAVLGFSRGLAFLSVHGAVVMGLASNGLLSTVSLLVGLVLLGAAAVGGPTASTMSVTIGTLFIVSGLASTVTLGTAMNIFAFRIPNIIFSFFVGLLLLVLGAYGRISGHLPVDNPYHTDPGDDSASDNGSTEHRLINSSAAAELAEAERADARRAATPEQQRRLSVVHQHRSAEERVTRLGNIRGHARTMCPTMCHGDATNGRAR